MTNDRSTNQNPQQVSTTLFDMTKPLPEQYIAMGWKILPCHWVLPDLTCSCQFGDAECKSKGKHPLTMSGFKDSSSEEWQLESWRRAYPSSNWAIQTGHVLNLIVIDLDTKKDENGVVIEDGFRGFSDLEAKHGSVPRTLRARTGSGGMHVFFKLPEGHTAPTPNSVRKLQHGVDVRGDGGYIIVAPSNHTKGIYEWVVNAPIAEIPAWLLTLVEGSKKAKRYEVGKDHEAAAAPKDKKAKKPKVTTRTREGIKVDGTYGEGGRNDALTSYGGLLRKKGYSVEDIEHALQRINLDHCNPPLDSDEVHGIAESMGNYEPDPSAPPPPPPGTDEEWRESIVTSDKGKVVPSAGNGILVLTHHYAWAGILGFDVRQNTTVWLKEPPFAANISGSEKKPCPRPLTDSDFTRVKVWLSARESMNLTTEAVREIVTLVSEQTLCDAVKTYYESLHWDGVDRLEKWLATYLGAEDNLLNSAYGMRWMISAVARTFRPGCKADCMLVLEGAQGFGKSQAIEALCKDKAWFTDEVSDLSGKDAAIGLGGKLLVEMGELSAMNRGEVEMVKRFMSCSTDHYRAPFGRVAADYPRRSVFAGSTNSTTYLRDDTGNRRFWSVAVGTTTTEADITSLVADRDQLWAEAVFRYLAGEPWWLADQAAKDAAVVRQGQAMVCDEWEPAIWKWIDRSSSTNRKSYKVYEVLQDALDIEVGRQTERDQTRVSRILVKLGYVRRRCTLNNERAWVYALPQTTNTEITSCPFWASSYGGASILRKSETDIDALADLL